MQDKNIQYVPPKYRISDKLLILIVDGERMLKDIANADLSASSTAKLTETATVENLFYLSRLIGAQVTRGEAKKIAVGKIPPGKQYRVLANYRSVMEYIKSVCNSSLCEITYTSVMHLNKLLGEGVGDEWDLGRVRSPGDHASGEFEPIPPKKIDAGLVAKTLPDLIEYLDKTEEIHPLIRGIILLSDLIQLYPFAYLNAMTVFASFDYYMNVKGVAGVGLVPIWQAAAEDVDTFVAMYTDIVNTGQAIDDFLELFVIGWHKSVETVRREVVKLSYSEEIKGKAKFLNLNHRQLAALRYLHKNLKVSRREYMKLFKVSTMTAYRDLSDLLDKKLLDQKGFGRGTFYVLLTRG